MSACTWAQAQAQAPAPRYEGMRAQRLVSKPPGGIANFYLVCWFSVPNTRAQVLAPLHECK